MNNDTIFRYPNLTKIPETDFTCDGKKGMFADVETNCQVCIYIYIKYMLYIFLYFSFQIFYFYYIHFILQYIFVLEYKFSYFLILGFS